METILNFCKNEYFMLGVAVVNVILLITFIISISAMNKVKKTYKILIRKIGKGNNIEDMLREYMSRVESVEEENNGIKVHCENLDKEITKCLKKVGIVRYSAFKDMGSDLSFAIALLDEHNTGVVLNGIYSVENSNVYAKPIENGKSKYTISEEEQKAIDMAMQ